MNLATTLENVKGQNWQVQALNGKALDPTVYTFKGLPELSFGADGYMSGHTGCNGFRAKYNMDENNQLDIKPGPMTKIYCEGVNENGFIEAINQTKSLKMDGEELLLVDSSGTEKMRLAKI